MKKRWFLTNHKHLFASDGKFLKIMKITIFIIAFASMQSFALDNYAQTKRMDVKIDESSIVAALEKIETQSEFFFFYNNKVVKLDKKVSVDLKDKTVNEILDALFKDTDIEYTINNRQIILSGKETGNSLNQQQKTISGKVTDQSGTSLPGVSVVVKGTTTGIITDNNGNYSLTNIPPNATLQFSFVGMKSQEVAIESKTTINVKLEEETVGIEEIVAIGYGTARKKDLTGSVVSANIDAFRESPNVNIIQSLQGTVPGLQIGQVNQAGQEPSIQIRGVNTLSGNKEPLIIVDEIIYSGRISDLNPSDIKSVEILKDVSSKAIYGSQAANGVLLITTKGGKKAEKPVFKCSSSVSFQNPTVNARLLNREETLEKIKGIYYKKAYLSPNYTEPNPQWAWGQSELVPNMLKGIDDGTDYDWWSKLTSPGLIEDYTFSLSGGMEKTTYYISGGYTKVNGIVINDDYKRYTTRINIKNDIKNWLTVGVNAFGSFSDFSGQSPSYTNIITTSPLVSPYDENGVLVVYPKGASTLHLNPLLDVHADDKDMRNRISVILYGDIKIPKIDGLVYRINYNQSIDWTAYANSNVYGASLTGSANKTNSSKHEETLDNILNYQKQFSDHGIKATLVYGYRKAGYNYTKAEGENIPNLSLSYNSLQQAITQRISSSAWNESSLYQMARVNYNYKDKYLVTGTLRRDGFSGFAKNYKFAMFPSVAVGWTLSNEPFFKIPKIDILKLRASYGQNGNQTARYSSIAQVSSIDDYKYVYGDGAPTSRGQSMISLSNNDLSWEKTSGMNLGIDFGKILN